MNWLKQLVTRNKPNASQLFVHVSSLNPKLTPFSFVAYVKCIDDKGKVHEIEVWSHDKEDV